MYELIQRQEKRLTQLEKLDILLQLAKLMNTFHNLAEPLSHGNLNSLNVFVEHQEQQDGSRTPRVLIGEIEMNDFKRYANMFYSYKSVSISSAPECLRNPKKRADPTPAMDSYSFAMIMWELLHDQQPFDGSLEAATQFVIEQDARPAIHTSHQSAQLIGSADISEMHEEVPEGQENKQVLT